MANEADVKRFGQVVKRIRVYIVLRGCSLDRWNEAVEGARYILAEACGYCHREDKTTAFLVGKGDMRVDKLAVLEAYSVASDSATKTLILRVKDYLQTFLKCTRLSVEVSKVHLRNW